MILITGGSSTLGWYLKNRLNALNIGFEALSRAELDLSNLQSLGDFFKGKSYEMIIHLAAETNVDLCEREPEKAYLLNSLATEVIALNAAKMGAKMVYISTSAVFGIIPKISYCELDTPMPINFYGSSKLYGERSVQRLCPNYLIIRSSWMIGGGPERDKKFIGKILPKLKNNEPVNAVRDKLGSLTYAKDLANFIADSLKDNHNGVMHMISSTDFCSRYDIAQYLIRLMGSGSVLEPIDSSTFPLSAPRPISEALYSCYPLTYKKKTCYEIVKEYLEEWQ